MGEFFVVSPLDTRTEGMGIQVTNADVGTWVTTEEVNGDNLPGQSFRNKLVHAKSTTRIRRYEFLTRRDIRRQTNHYPSSVA
jgi:hypothetical protein